MPFGVGDCVFGVIYETLEFMGYPAEALKACRGAMSDCLFVLISMLEDLFEAPGIQPSGKSSTAEDNSLRGLVMLMYAWKIHPALRKLDFFTYVLPRTYGDDVLAASKHEEFNNLYYRKVVREVYGMDFTTSDKTSEMEEYVTPQTMSFLKRTFVYSPYFKRVVAPISPDSIARALMWTATSSSIDQEEQCLGSLTSMLWELSLHLKPTVFNKVRKQFIQWMLDHFHLEADRIFPTYDSIRDSICGGDEIVTSDLSTEESAHDQVYDSFFNERGYAQTQQA